MARTQGNDSPRSGKSDKSNRSRRKNTGSSDSVMDSIEGDQTVASPTYNRGPKQPPHRFKSIPYDSSSPEAPQAAQPKAAAAAIPGCKVMLCSNADKQTVVVHIPPYNSQGWEDLMDAAVVEVGDENVQLMRDTIRARSQELVTFYTKYMQTKENRDRLWAKVPNVQSPYGCLVAVTDIARKGKVFQAPDTEVPKEGRSKGAAKDTVRQKSTESKGNPHAGGKKKNATPPRPSSSVAPPDGGQPETRRFGSISSSASPAMETIEIDGDINPSEGYGMGYKARQAPGRYATTPPSDEDVELQKALQESREMARNPAKAGEASGAGGGSKSRKKKIRGQEAGLDGFAQDREAHVDGLNFYAWKDRERKEERYTSELRSPDPEQSAGQLVIFSPGGGPQQRRQSIPGEQFQWLISEEDDTPSPPPTAVSSKAGTPDVAKTSRKHPSRRSTPVTSRKASSGHERRKDPSKSSSPLVQTSNVPSSRHPLDTSALTHEPEEIEPVAPPVPEEAPVTKRKALPTAPSGGSSSGVKPKPKLPSFMRPLKTKERQNAPMSGSIFRPNSAASASKPKRKLSGDDKAPKKKT